VGCDFHRYFGTASLIPDQSAEGALIASSKELVVALYAALAVFQ
jgi:hypothetical protein